MNHCDFCFNVSLKCYVRYVKFQVKGKHKWGIRNVDRMCNGGYKLSCINSHIGSFKFKCTLRKVILEKISSFIGWEHTTTESSCVSRLKDQSWVWSHVIYKKRELSLSRLTFGTLGSAQFKNIILLRAENYF